MSVWFYKDLGDGILASVPLGRIEEHFMREYARAGAPIDMALFIRQISEGRLHCEVSVYFSPAAAAVAEAVNAVPCGKPSPDGLSLLAGSEDSWAVLF
jgi:hypothetical protein